jgi:enoyl-CoA hydratase
MTLVSSPTSSSPSAAVAAVSPPAPVTYRLDDGIARITMDAPKVNVMSLQMLEALHAAFDRAKADEAIVVLSSALPGIFSAGFDLKVFAARDAKASHAMVKAGAELALKILQHPFPVLGACRGHAFPMGAFMLLACDVRIAAEGDYRIGLNEVAIGIPVPGFALELARQRLHPAWLNRGTLTGEMFLPKDAAVAGFFDKVVAADEFERTVEFTAQQMKQIHLPSHAITKQRLRAGAIAAVRAAIDAELTLEAYERGAATKSAVKLPG